MSGQSDDFGVRALRPHNTTQWVSIAVSIVVLEGLGSSLPIHCANGLR